MDMEVGEYPSEAVMGEVSRILREARFQPMPQGPLKDVYVRPNGNGNYIFGGVHEGIGEVHAWDPGLNAQTTNDPVEAASNLAAYVRAKLALTTEATLDAPRTVIDEPKPEPQPIDIGPMHPDERREEPSLLGEPGEAEYGAGDDVVQNDDAAVGTEAGAAPVAEEQPALPEDAHAEIVGDDDGSRAEGLDSDAYAESTTASAGVLDADFEPFTEPELVEGDDLGLGAIEDYSVEDAPRPEQEPASGAWIFGDNLGNDRLVRIAQLYEHAAGLIAATKAEANEQPGEHQNARSHVVTNMNEAGAYVGGNQPVYDRFVELEGVAHYIGRVERYRDERIDYIRVAMHDDVANFDPEAGWP